MLLDYGLHFIEIDGGKTDELWHTAKFWLYILLKSRKWQLESVALLLSRQGKGGLPVPNLHGCLDSAIHGSHFEDADGLTEALILLIREGADIYAKDDSGRSVSDIACCTETEWRYRLKIERTWTARRNDDLQLKEIWTEALSACGYNAEEVIWTSMRVEELSDSDSDSVSDQYDESDPAGSDGFEKDTVNPTCLICEKCGPECHCKDDDTFRQTDPTLHNQYEKSLLEGDAQVWRS